MKDVHLRVWVPENRNLSGWLYVEVDGRTERRIEVLARGSRGGGDTQFSRNGNTPTGEYDGSAFVNTGTFSQSSYGPWGAVRLKPLEGNALVAEKLFDRSGLLIHGGTLGKKGYWRGENELRATHGCLRVSNADMFYLRTLITEDADEALCVAQPRVRVSVTQ